ncbi:hypothetical protein DF048_30435 [Burkholderia seminalis]|nr:hypothetical protein DF048_30435 [Burkholderia seminalis]
MPASITIPPTELMMPFVPGAPLVPLLLVPLLLVPLLLVPLLLVPLLLVPLLLVPLLLVPLLLVPLLLVPLLLVPLLLVPLLLVPLLLVPLLLVPLLLVPLLLVPLDPLVPPLLEPLDPLVPLVVPLVLVPMVLPASGGAVMSPPPHAASVHAATMAANATFALMNGCCMEAPVCYSARSFHQASTVPFPSAPFTVFRLGRDDLPAARSGTAHRFGAGSTLPIRTCVPATRT